VNVAGSPRNGCVEAVFGITSPNLIQEQPYPQIILCEHLFRLASACDSYPTRVLAAVRQQTAGLLTALSSDRRADTPLGEVLTSPTHLPFVGEVLPCLRQAFARDEVTEPAIGTLALYGTFKLLAQV
jgi:hypothetical protein